MKYFIISLVFFFFASPANAAVLTLSTPNSTVTVNREFDVKVHIDTKGRTVSGADTNLFFDSTLLKVVKVTREPFFSGLISLEPTPGNLIVSTLINGGHEAKSGTGYIATIRFKALREGVASLDFNCSPGGKNDTNIADWDTGEEIVECDLLVSNTYIIEPTILQSLQIHTPTKTVRFGEKSIGLSALAYDQYNWPIWSGVTYEWGISSSNSIGSVKPIAGTITNFLPLNPGTGDVYVVARMGAQMQATGVQMTVTEVKMGDLNDDGQVNLNDLSTLLSNFGKTNRTKLQGDVNGDRNVTLADLSTLLSNFGK